LYMGNLCRSDSNVVSWFRMFQELDANSVRRRLASRSEFYCNGVFELLLKS